MHIFMTHVELQKMKELVGTDGIAAFHITCMSLAVALAPRRLVGTSSAMDDENVAQVLSPVDLDKLQLAAW